MSSSPTSIRRPGSLDALQFHFPPLKGFAWGQWPSECPRFVGLAVSVPLGCGGRMDLRKGDVIAAALAVGLRARLEHLQPALVIRRARIRVQRVLVV